MDKLEQIKLNNKLHEELQEAYDNGHIIKQRFDNYDHAFICQLKSELKEKLDGSKLYYHVKRKYGEIVEEFRFTKTGFIIYVKRI